MIFVASLLTSGTTATVALLRDGIELVVASVGDSRALLCRKGKPMKLTTDHTPERKDEKERYCRHYQPFYGVIAMVAIEMECGIPCAGLKPRGLFASTAVHSHYLSPDFLV